MAKITIDQKVKEECLDEMAWKCQRYNDNLKVITAFWDWIEKNELSASMEDYEKTIWLEEREDGEDDVEPDFFFSEEGEEYVLGEFKGTVSDRQIVPCVEDIEKYCSEFYPSGGARDAEEADPRKARAVFFLTHSDHVNKVMDEFKEEYEDFVCKGVPVVFVSYELYQSSGGQDKLRIEFEGGECGESVILDTLKEEGLRNPENNKEYDVRSLTMYRHTRDMDFYAHPPPDPYLAVEMTDHLRNYQNGSRPDSQQGREKVGKEEVISTFKEKYSSEYTEPKKSWIKKGLDLLEEYGWVVIDEDTITIIWDEFSKNRRIDDMYKYFAKERCREKAKKAAEGDKLEDNVAEDQATLGDGNWHN